MTPEQWDRVRDALGMALAMNGAERAGFVVELWRRDTRLGLDVGALLARDARDSFLEHPAAPRSRLGPGARLGPYTLHGLIGAGGMGDVYEATDTRGGRRVAIKVLPPELGLEPERRRRFEVEARALASLAHPHICAFYEFNSTRLPNGGEVVDYLVMERLHGETLAARLLTPPGCLPLDAALTVATQVAGALDAMHRQGIVHRDLKPANIMLTGSGARLFDFGLASLDTPGSAAAGAVRGRVVGTPHYMAPEQMAGGPTDARTDVYLLGLTLYEMVTGRRPFGSGCEASSSIEACAGARGLDRVIRRCLQREPARRWRSARELGDALQAVREGSTGFHHWRRAFRHPIGAAVLTTAAAAAALWLRRFGRRRRAEAAEGSSYRPNFSLFATPSPSRITTS